MKTLSQSRTTSLAPEYQKYSTSAEFLQSLKQKGQLILFSESRQKQSDSSFAGDKDKAIFTNRDGQTYYVKTGHSNEWVNLEILAAKLVEKTGVQAPQTKFAVGFERSPIFSHEHTSRKDKATIGDKPLYFVASKLVPNIILLKDIPAYLYQNPELLAPNVRDAFQADYLKLQHFSKSASMPITRYKTQRLKLFGALYQYFPADIKAAMGQIYAISGFIGNWDMMNMNLDNIGLIHQGGNLKPLILDLGNCLYAGFGGKRKRDSLLAANHPAHTPQSFPGDEDPKSNVISKNAARFVASSSLKLSNIPRNLPFMAFGLRKSDLRSAQADFQLETDRDFLRGYQSAVRRIAGISPTTIEQLTQKWLFVGQEINPSYPSGYGKFGKTQLYDRNYFNRNLSGRQRFMVKSFEQHATQAKMKSDLLLGKRMADIEEIPPAFRDLKRRNSDSSASSHNSIPSSPSQSRLSSRRRPQRMIRYSSDDSVSSSKLR